MVDHLIVRVPRLRVRKGPDAHSDSNLSFRRLRLGEQVERLAPAVEGWAEVKTKGFFTPIRGFVADRYLAELSSYPHLSAERLEKDFKSFAPSLSAGKRRKLVEAMVIGLPAAGIVSPRRIAHFLSQCAHESDNFNVGEEKLKYSAKRIIEVFGGEKFKTGPRKGELRWPKKDDPGALEFAKAYENNPEKFANYAYAWKIDNGDPESGDGYKYRGRGFIQLTGRGNYREVGKKIEIDLEEAPEKVNEDLGTAMLSACCFWALRDQELADRQAGGTKVDTLNERADALDVEVVTTPINAAAAGLKHRQALFDRAREIWGDPDAETGMV